MITKRGVVLRGDCFHEKCNSYVILEQEMLNSQL